MAAQGTTSSVYDADFDAGEAATSQRRSIQVLARIRPLQPGCSSNLWAQPALNKLEIETPASRTSSSTTAPPDRVAFAFNCLHTPSATQAQVFESVRPAVDQALAGTNVCVCAYGQTGSGKTYSMLGGGKYENRGIVQRCMSYLFDRIGSGGASCTLALSLYQVYEERCYDLLDETQRGRRIEQWTPLTVQERDGVLQLRGLRSYHIDTEADALALLALANVNRVTAATPANRASSRSHFIVSIQLTRTTADDGDDEAEEVVVSSRLNLVDLAGSERLHKQQHASSTSDRLPRHGMPPPPPPAVTTGIGINLSLHHLEQCILAMHARQQAVAAALQQQQQQRRGSVGGSGGASSAGVAGGGAGRGRTNSQGNGQPRGRLSRASSFGTVASRFGGNNRADAKTPPSSSPHPPPSRPSSSAASVATGSSVITGEGSALPLPHVPFRNSMLTSVLRDSLAGHNTHIVFIATLNPEADSTTETISTCRFAARCAMITTEVTSSAKQPLPSSSSSSLALAQAVRERNHLAGQLQAALRRAEAAEAELQRKQQQSLHHEEFERYSRSDDTGGNRAVETSPLQNAADGQLGASSSLSTLSQHQRQHRNQQQEQLQGGAALTSQERRHVEHAVAELVRNQSSNPNAAPVEKLPIATSLPAASYAITLMRAAVASAVQAAAEAAAARAVASSPGGASSDDARGIDAQATPALPALTSTSSAYATAGVIPSASSGLTRQRIDTATDTADLQTEDIAAVTTDMIMTMPLSPGYAVQQQHPQPQRDSAAEDVLAQVGTPPAAAVAGDTDGAEAGEGEAAGGDISVAANGVSDGAGVLGLHPSLDNSTANASPGALRALLQTGSLFLKYPQRGSSSFSGLWMGSRPAMRRVWVDADAVHWCAAEAGPDRSRSRGFSGVDVGGSSGSRSRPASTAEAASSVHADEAPGGQHHDDHADVHMHAHSTRPGVRSLPVASLLRVEVGSASPTFGRHLHTKAPDGKGATSAHPAMPGVDHDASCFSLVFDSRTLDLQVVEGATTSDVDAVDGDGASASTRTAAAPSSARDRWVLALRWLIQQTRGQQQQQQQRAIIER